MKNVKVGMVQRGEVDIGGGMFSLMKERAVNFKCSLTKISKNMKIVICTRPSFPAVFLAGTIEYSFDIPRAHCDILLKTGAQETSTTSKDEVTEHS